MKQDKVQKFVFSGTNMVISLYLCFMLGVFPLLYKYQYASMGDFKYFTFANTTLVFVLVLFLLIFAGFLLKLKKEGFAKWKTNFHHSGSCFPGQLPKRIRACTGRPKEAGSPAHHQRQLRCRHHHLGLHQLYQQAWF
jgi:hypothetical protein